MDQDIARLVRSAQGGDGLAWEKLVERLSPLVWSIARGLGLGYPDASDVVQSTWLKFSENLGSLRAPEKAAGWLATTARREAAQVLRLSGRQIPTNFENDEQAVENPVTGPSDERLLHDEQVATVWAAFSRLPVPCQELLRVLTNDAELSYSEVAALLDMPVGSIGPRRARCLDRLRLMIESAGEPSKAGAMLSDELRSPRFAEKAERER